jgi:hypothetical protein
MLCTSCSSPVRPIVAFDLDGTLGDYHQHFVQFAENYLQRSLPGEYDGSEEFSDYLGLKKEVYRDIKLAYRQGAQKRFAPIYDGAQETVNYFHSRMNPSVEIWIATTRPWLRLDNIDPDTRFWLDHWQIPYDFIIYGENKWDELLARVDMERVVAVVDDLYESCDAAASKGLLAIQPQRRHNRGKPWPIRGTFPDVRTYVRNALGEWKDEHAVD